MRAGNSRRSGMQAFLAAVCLFVLAASVRADQLVLISPHWEGIKHEFTQGFRKHYKAEAGRDVELKWKDVGGGTSVIVRYIESEFKNKPDGIGIDIMYGGGIEPFIQLKDKGLLVSYKLPDDVLKEVAPDIAGSPLYDKDHFWYAPTMAGFGIIYSKPTLKKYGLPQPKTWEDLARPEFFTWVGSGDPGKSGSVHMCYEIILQAYGWERGWEIITAMGANVRAFTAGGSQTPKDVATGDVACGLAIDFYAQMQAMEVGDDMIGYVYPAGLTVINGDGIGILKGTANRKVAESFVRFCMSEAGQKLWMLKVGEPGGPEKFDLAKFSVLPKLYDRGKGRTSVDVNPFGWTSDFRYDPERGALRYKMLSDLVRVLVIDPHQELADAWKQAKETGTTGTQIKQLAAMPIGEDEALELCRSGKWDDETFRNRKLLEWRAFATEKYGAGGFGRNVPALVFIGLVAFAIIYSMVRRRRRLKG